MILIQGSIPNPDPYPNPRVATLPPAGSVVVRNRFTSPPLPPFFNPSSRTEPHTHHNAVSQGLGAEAGEHHAVRGPQARAGEHGDGRVGHHGHVQGHEVALLDPQLLHGVGHAADPLQEVLVGDLGHDSRLVSFVQDGHLLFGFGGSPRAVHGQRDNPRPKSVGMRAAVIWRYDLAAVAVEA